MSARPPERRAGSVELTAGDLHVLAGFRVVTEELLAGGAIEMEFFVENLGSRLLQLAVSGDRARQRPGEFIFVATFAGTTLVDPMEGVVDLGGPGGVAEITNDKPWRQPLLLNQFVSLADLPRQLAPGESGRLELKCRRPLPLAATRAEALARNELPTVVVDLAFDLRRDDAALARQMKS